MSLLQLSKRTPDLLAATEKPSDAFKAPHEHLAEVNNLEAPTAASQVTPHELVSESSRMVPSMTGLINSKRLLCGNAHAEQAILELNSAAHINRGPDGVFESSRLHFDMLLGRDIEIHPSDYLNFNAMMKSAVKMNSRIPINPGRMNPYDIKDEPLVQKSFKNHEWPPNYITQDNVLDYFCNPANCFYETSSCNQQIRMQGISRPLEECLINMNGIQYVLWTANPPLFVICKHRRNSPTNVTPLAYYYVINGVVYQAPDLYTFIKSRMLASIEPMKKAFDEVLSYSRYNVAKGYYWEFKDKPAETSEAKPEDPQYEQVSNFQRTRADMLVKMLIDTFPANISEQPAALPSQAQQDDDMRSVRTDVSLSVRQQAPMGNVIVSNMNPPSAQKRPRP